MYLFIATIFIAELIIASALINLILKADKRVIQLNKDVLKIRPAVEDLLKAFKDAVYNLQNTVESFFTFVKKKRDQFLTKLVISIVMYASLIFFKGRFKKAAAVFQTLVLLKDYWDELAV